jgi:hypothetical protein
MKVKDWLSVVSLDSGGSISTIEFYDSEWFFIKRFDEVEDVIEEYGEEKILYVSFETPYYDDGISINLKLDKLSVECVR